MTFARTMLLQLLACMGALGLLAAQPVAGQPVLLVPLGQKLPADALAHDARILSAGPMPGSLIVTKSAGASWRYLVLGAPRGGCGKGAE